jgi:hypothetical protein
MWDYSQMKDDDPEKRIRELERELADMNRPPQSIPRYTGDASPYTSDVPPPAVDSPYTANPYAGNPYAANPPYTAPNQPFTSDPPPPYSANPPYSGNAPYVRDPTWGVDFRPPRRRMGGRFSWIIVIVLFAVFMPVIMSLVSHFATSKSRSNFGFGASNGPTAVPQGGELRVGGNSEGRTIACNDGKLTLYGYNSDYLITGHCASLTVGGYSNTVKVDSVDSVESSGYHNTVTIHDCNNGNLTLSSYGIKFNVTGHCASLAVSSYANNVTVDSVDSINVSGYSNVITYHSGSPKISDSGSDNKVALG